MKLKGINAVVDRMMTGKILPIVRIGALSAVHQESEAIMETTGVIWDSAGSIITAAHGLNNISGEYRKAKSVLENVSCGAAKKYFNIMTTTAVQRYVEKTSFLQVEIKDFCNRDNQKCFTPLSNVDCDEESDIAVLRLRKSGRKFPYLDIDPGHIPALNEEVYCITRENTGIKVLCANVIPLRRMMFNGREIIRYSIANEEIFAGDSGSPVLNSAGKVIGIILGGYSSKLEMEDKPLPIGIDKGISYCGALISSGLWEAVPDNQKAVRRRKH